MIMAKYIDLTGLRFERLTVLEYAGCKNEEAHWHCLCDCGNRTISSGRALRRKQTKSCGCYRRDYQSQNVKHGCNRKKGKTRAYSVWSGMIQRCTNPNDKYFFNYGGRGINVCEQWKDFNNFLSDMGEPPEGKTLDRIDNNIGYSPENCRWADRFVQMRNCRRNVVIEFEGKKQTLIEWAEETGIKFNTLQSRINNPKWTLSDALTKPAQRYTKSTSGVGNK